MDSFGLPSSPEAANITSDAGSHESDGDKSASQERVFAELEEDLSESIGTSLPTDLTLTTTFAEARDDDEDTDENQNKLGRRRYVVRNPGTTASRPRARINRPNFVPDRQVTKELIEKKQLEHDYQLLKIEFSQKSLLLENVKADFMGKVDELEEKLSDALHQKQMIQAKLETQIALQEEEHRRNQERLRHEIKAVLEKQEELESSNEELRIKAGNLKRNLTRDLFLSNNKYQELRNKDEKSLTIKDVVTLRIYETLKPLQDEISVLKSGRDYLQHSKSSLVDELSKNKETLEKQTSENKCLDKALKDLRSKLKDAEALLRERDLKKDNYDSLKNERDDLFKRNKSMKDRNDFLEIEVKKLSKEVDEFARENSSLRQSNTLMSQDKDYLNRQLRDLGNRADFAEGKLVKVSEELENAKQSREHMYEKYVLSREEVKNQYDDRLKTEMEGLKIRTGGEIERVRTSIREMYERENTNLREAREMALAEKEAAALGEKRLVEQVAKLLEESKSTTIALDSKLADAVNSLRMKTFEHETLQVLYEKTLQLQKDLQVENDTLTKKLDTITKDHFLSKSVLDQANSGMAQELKSLKDKLAVYENLEKELDEVVLQCAEIDDEAQAEKVLFAYGYGTNVPSTAKRRMMQSVHLARRVLALERANVSQRRTIEKSEERLKALTEELGRANAAIEQSQQPYGYLVQTVKLKDKEIKTLKDHISVMETDINQLSSERDRLQKIHVEMSSDLERLLNNRQEMMLMKKLLSSSIRLSKASPDEESALRGITLSGKGDGAGTDTMKTSYVTEAMETVEHDRPEPTIFTRNANISN